MRIVDLNILIYAVDRDSAHHSRIRPWLESVLNGDEPIGLPWIALIGFLRLATRPNVFQKPLAVEDACALVEDWLALPNVQIAAESPDHWRILRELVRDSGTAGNLTSDAHLAAIAIALGAKLSSCDADFGRFRGLRWENPLAQ